MILHLRMGLSMITWRIIKCSKSDDQYRIYCVIDYLSSCLFWVDRNFIFLLCLSTFWDAILFNIFFSVFGHQDNLDYLERHPKVVVISYTMLSRLRKTMLERNWSVMIVDESHNIRCTKKQFESEEVCYFELTWLSFLFPLN